MRFHPVFHEEGVISMVRPLTVIVALLFVSIAAAGCPVAHAQSAAAVTPAQEAAIEAGIKELSTQWSTAILKKDATILERIWAPDFVSVEPSGERVTKADGIAALKAGTRQPTVSEATSIDVRVYGGGTVAVDIGDYREAGKDDAGKPYDRRSRFTNVWVLRDGTWRCVTAHASVLEPKR
jgi:ketosteroid isomerase-like protein